jgi:hypothetical protein
MCLRETLADKEELEAYIDGLIPPDNDEVKARLRRLLSDQELFEEGIQHATLPEQQVTQAYLERIFPDEDIARAYLSAIKDRDPRITEIEGSKREATVHMAGPSPDRRDRNFELLELVWGIREGSIGGDAAERAIMKIAWGGENNVFDTWAEAELSRVKMQAFIRELNPANAPSRRDLIEGTFLENTKMPLQKWIIAAALVAQAKESPTATRLEAIFPTRTTASHSLEVMRKAMAQEMKTELKRNKPKLNGYQIIDRLAEGFRLYYNRLRPVDNNLHRRDIVIRRVGKMWVMPVMEENILPDDTSDENDHVRDAFNQWISPHLLMEDPETRPFYLYEFAYRYNDDKARLLGWRLINGLLRTLLAPKNKIKSIKSRQTKSGSKK